MKELYKRLAATFPADYSKESTGDGFMFKDFPPSDKRAGKSALWSTGGVRLLTSSDNFAEPMVQCQVEKTLQLIALKNKWEVSQVLSWFESGEPLFDCKVLVQTGQYLYPETWSIEGQATHKASSVEALGEAMIQAQESCNKIREQK